MEAEAEYDSLFAAIPTYNTDEVVPPIEGEVLDGVGLGYVRITTFSDDYNLMAQLWEHYIQGFIANEVEGLIIDVRTNSGGSGGLALDFAGYFFDEEIILSQEYYYNDNLHEFEVSDHPSRILPAPIQFDGPIAVLVSPYCVSACEGFSYAMSQQDRAIVIVVGHAPTAGAFGEVGRGQYSLPEGLTLQFPTGRPETPDGQLLIEGKGVEPDITVPVTEDSALGYEDAVLNAAIDAVLEKVK
jgi:C-terminal processing protease CtpA/Prc